MRPSAEDLRRLWGFDEEYLSKGYSRNQELNGVVFPVW